MTSTKRWAPRNIILQFDLDRNIDAAAQDVQSAIDAAGGQLPKNLPSPPNYRKVNPADSAILILSVHSDVLPLTTVDDYAENILAQQISQIPGVAQVNIGGQQKPAVRVQIDPAKLAALGLQLEDVANVISQATVDAPKGSINGPTRSMTIYDNDQLLKAAPWNDVVVAYKNGAPVRIRDIGVAVDGPENRLITAWQNGRRGILLLIYKQPGANVIDAVRRVQALLPHALPRCRRRSRSTPWPIAPRPSRPRSRTSRFTLAITIVLVVMVIFLFLRNAWATIIPGVTVPLALFGTVALMYVLHFSLDNLSLDGPDHCRRLRRRRRHRHAGEHLPAYRGGLVAAAGDAQGRRRDRLHDHVDEHFAGRGVHSAAAHGRHHRPTVPRVCDYGDDDHRGIRVRRADAVADHVRLVPAR